MHYAQVCTITWLRMLTCSCPFSMQVELVTLVTLATLVTLVTHRLASSRRVGGRRLKLHLVAHARLPARLHLEKNTIISIQDNKQYFTMKWGL